MTISKQQNGTTLEIALEGRLDTTTAPELEKDRRSRSGPASRQAEARLHPAC